MKFKELKRSNPWHWVIALCRVIRTRYRVARLHRSFYKVERGDIVWKKSGESVLFVPDCNGTVLVTNFNKNNKISIDLMRQHPVHINECFKP